MTPRILVIDGHELVRQGVRAVVESQPGWTLAAECGGGEPAVALALSLQPDVVVLDPQPDRDPGLETLRSIRAGLPTVEVVALSGDESEPPLREALAAGARAVVLKSEPRQQLVAAIEAAARHEAFFSPRASALLLQGYLRPREAGAPPPPASDGAAGGSPPDERGPAFPLTPREREIVQLVAAGRTSKEVASRLGLSVKTVEAHRANVMRKLGLHSVADLVRYAVRHHLVDL